MYCRLTGILQQFLFYIHWYHYPIRLIRDNCSEAFYHYKDQKIINKFVKKGLTCGEYPTISGQYEL